MAHWNPHELRTEIEIGAPAERVREILTDCDSYPSWNPFIRHIQDSFEMGRSLIVRLQPSSGMGITVRPRVTAAERPRELRWLGRLLMPGLFDGEHRFVIEPLSNDRVRFLHSERFSGLLVPLLRGSLDRDTRRGFTEMNAALKQQAEVKGRNAIP